MGQLTTDNIVTIADETIPLSEINDSDLVLLADSEGNFKKTTIEEIVSKCYNDNIEEIVSKCYNDNILGKEKANVPLETPYVQLPNMPTPDTLYLGTWEDVSASYDGAYLRVLGTDSGEFGTLQAEGLPNITGFVDNRGITSDTALFVKWNGVFYNGGYSDLDGYNRINSDSTNALPERLKFDASRSNSIYGASKHVTPKAHAIKIWKRTA